MRIRRHLTFANVASAIALFVALGGGTAVALNGSNTVQSDDLGPGSQVKAPDVDANAVNGTDVVDNSLSGADVNEAALDATPLRTRAAQGGCSPSVVGTGPMVKVGPTCIDKYEASVWSQPTGGIQYGVSSDNYPCGDNGQNVECKGQIFARSVPNVPPSRFITYFQAQQALANSGKRLPTNAEWQAAVAGTPEGQCNRSDGVVQATGLFTDCVSHWGAFDMVGNLWEWVADWDEQGAGCANWPTSAAADYGSDSTCVGSGSGDASTRFPAALIRGGFFNSGTAAGPFAVNAFGRPSESTAAIGFRGAR